jgi:D-alanyl-D-alanine carboxypeptidase/D-alanyl-D-alanine-endopeptidase (penicillin-binding protein 4)
MHHPITSASPRPRYIVRALILAGILLFLPRWAEGSTVATLRDQLEAAIAPVARRAVVGAAVVSLDRKETLWERNPYTCSVPASNQKLLTAAAALDRLGPNARLRTEALALGPVRPDGTLDGDLILRGGGDPLLTTADLQELAAAVRSSGVRRVRGLLRADDSRYAREPLGEGWSWDDEPYGYAAQVGALTVDGNVAEIAVTPGARPGLPARVRVTPAPGYLSVEVACRTVPAGRAVEVAVTRERARNQARVMGSIPLDSPSVLRRVTVEEPALHAATAWRQILAHEGVAVNGGTRHLSTPPAARVLAWHDSPPLAEIVAQMNKVSDNLVAETLLRELGRSPGTPGSTAGGLRVVREVAGRLGCGESSLVPVDGSGLSRQNLVTPADLCRLLAAMDTHPAREAFLSSLPIAGRDGTLRARMTEGLAAGNARAKTGSLAHVSALSGYVTTADGERLAFSLVINNDPGPSSRPDGPKRTEDAVVQILAGFRR